MIILIKTYFFYKKEWSSILVFFLNDVPGWSFMVDILLNFNTAFYKKGVIITGRK